MRKELKCQICGKKCKSLTKEFLCAFCHKDKYGSWSSEFSAGDKLK